MKHPTKLAALAGALLLASCGGGSDSSPVANGTTTTTTTANGSTSAPGATYSAGSAQAGAFAQLNAARTQCGFGALAQAAELDVSASAHASYMALNGAYGHDEVQGRNGFTGVQFSDRESAAGYRWVFAGEVLAQVNTNQTGSDAVRALLAVPYHAALMLEPFHDVGFGWSNVNGFPTLTADLGTRSGQSGFAPGGVVTYPCNGISDAVAAATGEVPSPFPSNASARWGQSVTVKGPSDLRLDSVSITGPSGSVQILATYGAGQMADPNNTGDFTQGTFAIIPAPLQTNTTYSVSIAYTTGGAPGRRDFTFTTAAR